jgi:hypothetical protein
LGRYFNVLKSDSEYHLPGVRGLVMAICGIAGIEIADEIDDFKRANVIV